MMKQLLFSLVTFGVVAVPAMAQGHEHINAGAQSVTAGSMLILDGAEAYLADSGFVWETALEPGGYFPGYYATIDLTFTSLPATLFYGGPEGSHAAVGANLRMQIVSVEGPAGGSFGYWEAGDYFSEISPTAVFAVGSSTPTSYSNNSLSSFTNGYWTFNLTEAAPADPYGHVHDRAYSFTAPGTYEIGFRIIDSTGFHADSQVYTLAFGVIPEPGTCVLVLMAGLGLAARRRKRRI